MLCPVSRVELAAGGWLSLREAFVPDEAAVMQRLVATLPLVSERLRIFGREHPTPRLTSFHGDPGCNYRYSRRTFAPHAWTEELLQIRQRLRALHGHDFNAVLCNLYRDGRDAMGKHADDEAELGPSPDNVLIASVSLGARRRFVLRARETQERHVFELGHGDLLTMGGTTQRHYTHHLARTARPVGPRLNLTFRLICRR